MAFLYSIFFAYLLGSIPFGYLLTRYAGMGDIRNIGSGNIGATNVLRTGNKKLAALTLLMDGVKGAVAVLIVSAFVPPFATFAAMAALAGHMYPVWLRFKGGKGVATMVGVTTALAWPVGLATMLIWTLVAVIYRYSSLAALVALGLSPIVALFFGYYEIIWLQFCMLMLVYWKHRENIQRLMKGEETKIGASKGATPPTE